MIIDSIEFYRIVNIVCVLIANSDVSGARTIDHVDIRTSFKTE